MSRRETVKIEDYLGPYEIILAHRIKETIIMFDEGIKTYYPNPRTFKERRSRALLSAAARAARDDRAKFIQMHNDIPTRLLAELFEMNANNISALRRGKRGPTVRKYKKLVKDS